MVEMCKKYTQDSVLVTFPHVDFEKKDKNGNVIKNRMNGAPITRFTPEMARKYGVKDIVGHTYDKNGNLEGILKDVSYQDIQMYFTALGNTAFEFKTFQEVSSSAVSLLPIDSCSSAVRSSGCFKQRFSKVKGS
jgi:uncharacterized Fe-S cluster-containing protein